MGRDATGGPQLWPRLTIVTPSYNQGQFLEDTIRSVLEQGYPSLEYFVVDGGSTDDSVPIIRGYANQLSWWTSEPDRGQSDAINKGLRRATGAIVAWINSDDTYEPGALAKAAAALRDRPDVGMIYGDVNYIDASGRVIRRKRELAFDRVMGSMIGFGLLVPQPTAFWRRELLDRVGYLREDLHYNMDGEYWSRMARVTRIEHLPVVLANTRWHPDAKTYRDITEGAPRVTGVLRQEIQRSYQDLAISRLIPFRYSGPLRRLYRLKRFVARLVRGHYFAQRGWW